MSESYNKIPFSYIRKEIRKILRKPQSEEPSFPAVDFMPCDLKIWTGKDSDFFHRAFCHHRMILKIILSGNATTCIDGIRYRLKPSDAILYFPMQTHSTETNDRKFEYLAISFVVRFGRYDALDCLKNRVFSPDPESRFLTDLVRAWNENAQMRAACLLAELLSSAAAKYSQTADFSDNEFSAIADYVRKHCSGELSVKKIAADFGISPQSVRRIFQRNINGLTPGGLIRQQRLIAAKELLRRTDLSLQEIALKCGFSTAFSFSRSFRKQYGIPPSVYRSENR